MYTPVTRVVLLDIETLPADAIVGMSLDEPPEYALQATEPSPVEARLVPKNYKSADTISAWQYKERLRQNSAEKKRKKDWLVAAKKHYAKQSLNPSRGRISHLGLGVYEFPTSSNSTAPITELETHVLCGDCGDEKDILKKGWEIMKAQPAGTNFVAHNGHAFDYPFIQLRAIKHGMMDMARFFSVGKPWESPLVDTMVKWPATGFGAKRSGRSVDAIMEFLGDERPENPFTGADVLPAYVAGSDREIRMHCLDDLRCLLKIYTIIRAIEK
ncbi:MAG: hypothetical protein QF848_15395 [Planctomycetota bacterium]|jgi:hypothetical protein|nr:hypothetical protein [Planctomycetota bacterium]